MADNIYLKLELFLDPAITDATALKQELEKKISEWNKKGNAAPKYKQMVTIARECIKQGFGNLPKQASEARSEMLNKLQKNIEDALLASGSINEKGTKMLRSRYPCFTEATIKAEINQRQGDRPPALPVFTPPAECPPSLQCERVVSFSDMKTILSDLSAAGYERHCNLYDFLDSSFSTTTTELLEQAKKKAEYVRMMPSKDAKVDALNRLSGKAVNFFKDTDSRKGYDMALKRLPFDRLCEEQFELRCLEGSITWKIYQLSITETCEAVFSQQEAEWLVYDYYCNTKKCPAPIPERLETLARVPVKQSGPSVGQMLNGAFTTTNNTIANTSKRVWQTVGTWMQEVKSKKPKPAASAIPPLPSPLPFTQPEVPPSTTPFSQPEALPFSQSEIPSSLPPTQPEEQFSNDEKLSEVPLSPSPFTAPSNVYHAPRPSFGKNLQGDGLVGSTLSSGHVPIPSFGKKLQQFFDWMVTATKKTPPPITQHHQTNQFDHENNALLFKDFQSVKKRCGNLLQMSTMELNIEFMELESIVAQLKNSGTRFPEVITLRAKIAEKLADATYHEDRWGLAWRYYQAILECVPNESKALARVKEIDDARAKTCKQLNLYLASDDFARCFPIMERAKQKFSDDPETDDFLRNFETRMVQTKLTTAKVQRLVDEKKCYTLVKLLELMIDIDKKFSDVYLEAKKRLDKAEPFVVNIRQMIGASKLDSAKTNIDNLEIYIPDHPEIPHLKGLLKDSQDEALVGRKHAMEIESELKLLMEKKQWVSAENHLRTQLATSDAFKSPQAKRIAREITIGVTQYQNMLRLLVAALVGGAIWMMTVILLLAQYGYEKNKLPLFLLIGFGFVSMYIALTGLYHFLRTQASPFSNTGTIFKYTTCYLFVMVTFSVISNELDLSNWCDKLVASRQDTMNENEMYFLKGMKYVFLLGLPIVSCWGIIYAFQVFLYGLIKRFVETENWYSTYRLFRWSIALFIVLCCLGGYFASKSDSEQPNILASSLVLFGLPTLLWGTTCWSVYKDYSKELDTSFQFSDLRDYLHRRSLLKKWKDVDSGKTLLVETNWYRNN